MDTSISLKFNRKKHKRYIKFKKKIRKYLINQKRCCSYKGIIINLIKSSFCLIMLWFYLNFYKIQFSLFNNFSSLKKNKEQIIIPDLRPLVNNKLYWNNRTSLEIDKIREEIKTYENLEISYDNPDDFKKRKKPKIFSKI